MRNERNVTQTLYIEIHVSQWIETCRELSRIKTCKLTVEELSRIYREVFIAKGSRWIEKLSSIQKVPRWIEQLSSIQKVPRWIEQLSSNYRECDKKKLKRLNRQPSCREVSSSCQDYLKIVFQEEKNTDMNAIKHALQPQIQTTFQALKIISQQEKCQAHRSKTHTY